MTTVPSLLSRRATERKEARQAPAPEPKVAEVDKTAKLAAIRQDAQRRSAAAWTMAKTLIPSASPKAQQHLASALVQAPTAILAESLRATARLAYYTKAAEAFESKTKKSLNEFVEDEGLLSKLMTEVLSENKADAPKTAAAKTAAPPAGLAEAPPEAPAPTEAPGEGMPAGAPDAPQGEFQEPAPAGDAAPGAMGDPGAGVDPAMPANAVGDQAAEGDLLSKINETESQINDIQSEVEEAGDEALDLASIFNPEVQADKAQNLANEGEGSDIDMDEMEGEDFGPSDTSDMQDAADFGAPEGGEMTDADFFKGASGPDPMAVLLGRTAAEGVDVEMGDMAKHFETDLPGDTRDAESDVDDLFGEVLVALDQPTMDQKRDTEPKFEEPEKPQVGLEKKSSVPAAKAQPAKKSSIKTVGVPTTAAPTAKVAAQEDLHIAKLIFHDEEY